MAASWIRHEPLIFTGTTVGVDSVSEYFASGTGFAAAPVDLTNTRASWLARHNVEAVRQRGGQTRQRPHGHTFQLLGVRQKQTQHHLALVAQLSVIGPWKQAV